VHQIFVLFLCLINFMHTLTNLYTGISTPFIINRHVNFFFIYIELLLFSSINSNQYIY
jgi:hypothetical protein